MGQIMMMRCAAAFMGMLLLAAPVPAMADDDRHAGYYFPEPQSEETYFPRAETLLEANKERRLGFVTGLTQSQLSAPYPLTHVVFAKGAESEKLIIVALQDGMFDTIYRARAFLAAMTASARTTPIFGDLQAETSYTFFDLAVLLGFEQITISDGKLFSHRIVFE